MTRCSLSRLLFTIVISLCVLSACSQDQPSPNSKQAEPLAETTADVESTDSTMPPGLPQLSACQNTSQPVLPAKWTASALMQTFGEYDVVVGKFTYDEPEQAYRFSLSFAGSEQFTDYLLTADQRLYALQGDYQQPSSCNYSLILQMDLPARQLMSNSAQCVGQGSINGIVRQWWKDRADPQAGSANKGANWYWFNADSDRNLFRMMPYKGVDDFGWAGKYAFTYFSEFESLEQTNIAELKALCNVQQPIQEQANESALSLAEALTQLLPEVSEATQASSSGASAFLPEVQQCSSSSQQPPAWPSTLRTTTLLTAVNVDYSPFPSLVRYSASQPGLRTDMYNPWPQQDKAWDLYSARLMGNTGYSAFFQGLNFSSCRQDLPGPPVPNWMAVDQCECKASLPPGSALNPRDENLLVMMCPLTPSSLNPKDPQVFWTWYGEQSGSPQVFMQSDSSASAGTGLNLADYYSWESNAAVDPQIFTPPSECIGQPKVRVPIQCHNCHLPTNSEIKTEGPVDWHIRLHHPKSKTES